MRTIAHIALLASLAALPALARAENPTGEALQRARIAFAEYGLLSGETLAALRGLAPLAAPLDILEQPSREAVLQQQEASYLRAAAAIDMLVVSAVTPEQVAVADIADAYGTGFETLRMKLRADLEALSPTPFGSVAGAAPGVLELVEPSPERDAMLRGGAGVRRDLLLGSRVIDLLDASGDAQQALAAFGSDPCDGPGACPEPFARFDASGRRAMWTLCEAGRALQRVDQAARSGDALANAAALETMLYRDRLRELTLEP